ncbi:MAG: hypothetical protein JWO48_3088 [Bryobacterales bacterium]|nr:hypothetical protein [Bryobacterales bacterium]
MCCRTIWTFALLTLLAPVAPSTVHRRTPHEPTHTKTRLKQYRKSTFGPGAVARSAAGAGVQQWRNHPREWGHGVKGYGRRFASGFGQHAVKNTIQFGVGALRHEDPRSTRPLKPKGFRPKIKDAFRNTFTVRRYGHQKRGLAAGRISGAMGAGLISRAWQPSSLATAGAGLQSGGISLGADLAINTAREFIPDKKKHGRTRHIATNNLHRR